MWNTEIFFGLHKYYFNERVLLFIRPDLPVILYHDAYYSTVYKRTKHES